MDNASGDVRVRAWLEQLDKDDGAPGDHPDVVVVGAMRVTSESLPGTNRYHTRHRVAGLPEHLVGDTGQRIPKGNGRQGVHGLRGPNKGLRHGLSSPCPKIGRGANAGKRTFGIFAHLTVLAEVTIGPGHASARTEKLMEEVQQWDSGIVSMLVAGWPLA